MAPPSTAEQYPPSTAFDDMTEVLAGKHPDTKSFKFHKGVLCFYSGYFEKALNGSFEEAKTSVIKLSSENPTTLELVQYWLYNRRFQQLPGTDPTKTSRAALCELWVFGDAHDMPLLQNYVINVLHEKMIAEWTVPLDVVNYVYDNTLSDTPLRKYLAAAIGSITQAETSLTPEYEDSYPKDALIDSLRVVWKSGNYMSGQDVLRKWDMCQYHVHEGEVKCEQAGA